MQPGASNGTYGAITSQDINPQSGQPIGQPQNIQSHIDSGQLKGLIDMRDGTLADLNQELGNLAETTANAYNTQNNANASFPPPTSLTGRNTGLVAGDALNFTGKTTIAVADANGNLVSRVDVDFDAGTLSVDGGAPAAFGNTVGGFTAALNGALGANGTASFVDGALTISATGTNGIVTKDDPATPANRGASGFSQFFGLNDLFRSAVPTIKATGLSAGDASGLAPGSSISMSLTGPNGEVAKTATVSIVAGMTIGNVVTALNTAMSGQAIFTLNGDGSISETQPTALSGFNLNVTADTTQRGTTGVSFTQLFGIGVNQTAQAALSFSINPQLAASPSVLPSRSRKLRRRQWPAAPLSRMATTAVCWLSKRSATRSRALLRPAALPPKSLRSATTAQRFIRTSPRARRLPRRTRPPRTTACRKRKAVRLRRRASISTRSFRK